MQVDDSQTALDGQSNGQGRFVQNTHCKDQNGVTKIINTQWYKASSHFLGSIGVHSAPSLQNSLFLEVEASIYATQTKCRDNESGPEPMNA